MSNKYVRFALPHVVAFFALLVFAFAFFSPALSGQVLSQGDNLQAYGMQHELRDYIDNKGEVGPLWTNAAFGGMPSYQIMMRGGNNLIQYCYNVFLLGNDLTKPHTAILLCMLGLYLLLIVLKIDWRIAIIGSIVYGLGTNFVILTEAGHSTKIITMAYVAPTLAGMLLAWRGKYWLGGSVTALFFALQLLANHVQITYYFAFCLVFIAAALLVEAMQQKQLATFFKGTATIAVACLLAICTVAPRLWTTYEYTQETTRGTSDLTAKGGKSGLDKDYAFGWSYGVAETMTLLIPNYKGGGASSTYDFGSMQSYQVLSQQMQPEQLQQQLGSMMYFGDQPFTSGPVYLGAIVCFLFFLGLALSNNKLKWGLLAATIFAMMIAWGKNFEALNYFLFDHFPMFNKFRTVSMALSLAAMTVLTVAMLGLQAIFSADIDKKQKTMGVYIAAGLVGGLLLVGFMMNGGYTAHLAEMKMPAEIMSAVAADRQSLFTSDLLRSLLFIVFAVAALWLHATNTINWKLSFALVAVLMLADTWSVSRRYVDDSKFQDPTRNLQFSQETPADTKILEDKDLHYRVVDFSGNPFQSARASYHHKSMGGYFAAKLGIIQTMFDKYLSKPNEFMPVYALFNTKYAITQDGKPARLASFGNAWFVKTVEVVPTPDAELDSLGRLDARNKAVIRKANEAYLQGLTIQFDTTNTIKLTAYHPDKLSYKSSAKSEQFALFSEIYYPPAKGWNTYIDNKLDEKGFIQADYAIRGLRVPAGEHTIEMRFEPKSFYTGNMIALISSLLLLIFLGAALFFTFRQADFDSLIASFDNLPKGEQKKEVYEIKYGEDEPKTSPENQNTAKKTKKK